MRWYIKPPFDGIFTQQYLYQILLESDNCCWNYRWWLVGTLFWDTVYITSNRFDFYYECILDYTFSWLELQSESFGFHILLDSHLNHPCSIFSSCKIAKTVHARATPYSDRPTAVKLKSLKTRLFLITRATTISNAPDWNTVPYSIINEVDRSNSQSWAIELVRTDAVARSTN